MNRVAFSLLFLSSVWGDGEVKKEGGTMDKTHYSWTGPYDPSAVTGPFMAPALIDSNMEGAFSSFPSPGTNVVGWGSPYEDSFNSFSLRRLTSKDSKDSKDDRTKRPKKGCKPKKKEGYGCGPYGGGGPCGGGYPYGGPFGGHPPYGGPGPYGGPFDGPYGSGPYGGYPPLDGLVVKRSVENSGGKQNLDSNNFSKSTRRFSDSGMKSAIAGHNKDLALDRVHSADRHAKLRGGQDRIVKALGTHFC